MEGSEGLYEIRVEVGGDLIRIVQDGLSGHLKLLVTR